MTLPTHQARSTSRPGRPGRPGLAIGLVLVVAVVGGGLLAIRAFVDGRAIRVGAVFPLSTNAGPLAKEESLGVSIAAGLVNADGGIQGRPVKVLTRDLPDAASAPAAIADLKAQGVPAVIGAYASDLSIAASAATDAAGLVYWESGAVADRLTGRGLPLVFRVGASGNRLGTNSAQFAASQLAPRLGTQPDRLRVTVVDAQDAYATSVADAAVAETQATGMILAARIPYDLNLPDWPTVMTALAASRPDIVILASHVPDGIAFRQAMLAAGIKVDALIGTTMAECMPDFGADLGLDALGVFGSDRPPGNFDATALDPAARAIFDRFAAAWRDRTGTGPTEEGLSGFTAALALFHDVLPAAVARGDLSPGGIAAAARAVDLPDGSLPNGAGLRFSKDPRTLGQNLRAAAVIWQWQRRSAAGAGDPYNAYSGREYGGDEAGSDAIIGPWDTDANGPEDPSSPVTDVVVWPGTFGWGSIRMVPLAR
jgi:branched-chain amino acid transport system substrate-binding protein